MPLNKRNTHVFHRFLYAGQLSTLTLRKRGDNQQQGTIRDIVLHECRWGKHNKTGNTLDGDMNVGHWRMLHIPRIELDRVGVQYLNPTDEFIDQEGRHWNTEGDNTIDVKLFENHVCVELKRRRNLA